MAKGTKDIEKGPGMTFTTYVSKCKGILRIALLWILIISDILLLLYGFVILGLGVHVKQENILITTLVYRTTFDIIGSICIGVGVLTFTLIAPVGIIAAYWSHRTLLKLHNVVLLIFLMVEGVVLWYSVRYYERNNLMSFKEHLEQACDGLIVNYDTNPMQCCAQADVDICIPYRTKQQYKGKKTAIFESDCRDAKPFYQELLLFVYDAMIITCFTIIIQSVCFLSGFFYRKMLALSPEEKKRREIKLIYEQNQGRCYRAWLKSKRFILKKFMLLIFGAIFCVAVVIGKLWYKGFKIKYRNIDIDLLMVMHNAFNRDHGPPR
ncbi:hypothetical protein GWI33_007344 [Rhynchophorus ferrugineus]|uniref:Tetraspanin n=1 Tax=Rhynchophorus ferrugineus TaxID=354439 RepID=A0A834MIC3_RHYFE|nr:hypothetical protein GWI33_007344 [Rhynchophorus ferrugineus]